MRKVGDGMKRQIVLMTVFIFSIFIITGCGMGLNWGGKERSARELIQRDNIKIVEREQINYFARFQDENNRGTSPNEGETEGKNRIVYLTFDDGPTENTQGILSILKDFNAKATFFVNGRESDFAKKIYQQIVLNGHALGNHTYSHQYEIIYSDLSNFKADFYELQALLKETTGVEPKYFRFPGGSNSTRAHQHGGEQILWEIRSFLDNNGYVFFDWNVDSRDSAVQNQSKEVIIQETLAQVKGKNQAIVIFHDGPNKESTVEALPAILDQLAKWGYSFKTLSKDAPKQHFQL
ncbi:peptidoglycan/xylan/chitin deacetylase (PgdA/CDA1 family) [Evansella vedderi]|uniref:Peptidoglycan/xylan/chitin deacetylase (PgdA/CDA1 family) n=1 Tax=Evansella vedderi TaxID=38282 RepID=A0ABU0A2E2_9BACI|nr:polysaccharide deacetylase family protein [Evansella vedderi]MDQ0257405.1 peptidoglycan/xylan/chitin deacetylase (PgdA/CDA1 family) [Evansella vedderi]